MSYKNREELEEQLEYYQEKASDLRDKLVSVDEDTVSRWEEMQDHISFETYSEYLLNSIEKLTESLEEAEQSYFRTLEQLESM